MGELIILAEWKKQRALRELNELESLQFNKNTGSDAVQNKFITTHDENLLYWFYTNIYMYYIDVSNTLQFICLVIMHCVEQHLITTHDEKLLYWYYTNK